MQDTSAIQTFFATAQSGKAFSKEAARKAAEDFEGVFVTELLDSMSKGLKTEGPFTGGQGEETYRGLLNEAMAKEISRHGGVGIADQVYREILKMQEAKGAVPSDTGTKDPVS